jgi:four helix bundle protein
MENQMGKHMPVEELEVYKTAEQFADAVWDAVIKWELFARDALGKQLARSADSIGANIAEGGGDESPVENRRYLRHSRRSLRETRWHLRRAYARRLLSQKEVGAIRSLLDQLSKLLTGYFKYVDQRCKEMKKRK